MALKLKSPEWNRQADRHTDRKTSTPNYINIDISYTISKSHDVGSTKQDLIFLPQRFETFEIWTPKILQNLNMYSFINRAHY